ncbi:hypothetical protein G5714_020902 [Onychostoma macrolepis]|uniref:Uncharacterized protein n=1 Tax=Onychostoma macrolepis TaxID=369639 RepID=A0A7J6BYZ3_9TELE|nr:hypothetical protein G5714_020902 [Onychostoma macrolepis]
MASVGWKYLKSLKYVRDIMLLTNARQKGFMDEKCQMDIVRQVEESIKPKPQFDHQKNENKDMTQMENKQKVSQSRAINTAKLKCNSLESLRPNYFRPWSYF